jgi:hypothetical protein
MVGSKTKVKGKNVILASKGLQQYLFNNILNGLNRYPNPVTDRVNT